MYQIANNLQTNSTQSVIRLLDSASIPFDPANTDYQTFRQQINADGGDGVALAQLEDADGNLMTAEEAKAFVATLP